MSMSAATMTTKGGLIMLAALVALLVLMCDLQAEAKPHIIMMVLDDIGRLDTGVYGESNIPTPRINGIAKDGVIFENFYTQPVCSPTRSSLLTGRYPFRFGMQHLLTQLPGMKAGAPLDTPMIPALLAAEGYERHAIGKWHVGYATWEHTPTKRGFQSYTGYLQGQGNYYTHNFNLQAFGALNPTASKVFEKADGLDFWENTRPVYEAVGNYSLDIYRAAMTKVLRGYTKRHETLEKQQQNPLFIYMAHQTVHVPLQYKREEERCEHLSGHKWRRMHCNMMVELDDAVGEMVDQLKTLGLWDNTLILTTTDNGGMVNYLPDDDDQNPPSTCQGSNYPLRGSKTTLFDGGVRSVAFAAGGYIPKEGRGRVVKDLAHVVDYTATILTLGGVLPAKKECLQLDGHNLFDVIANKRNAQSLRDHVPINIIQGGKRYSAVRFGKYKVIIDDYANVDAQGWHDRNGDLYEQRPPYVEGEIFLFDLESDPQERKNVASENPGLVKYGQDLIRSYVEGGEFMEPQDSSKLYAKAFPPFQGGVWKPFMTAKEWYKFWDKEKAKAKRNAKAFAQNDLLFSDDVIDEDGSEADETVMFTPSSIIVVA